MQSKNLFKDNFLNTKNSVELPSNLLNFRGSTPASRQKSMSLRASKIKESSQRYEQNRQNVGFIGEKNGKEKQVLYKRLRNIQGDNKQIQNLSFSKMLSRMVVIDDEEIPRTSVSPFQQRARQTLNITPIPTKLYRLNCTVPTRTSNCHSVSTSVPNQSQKLFNKLYVPSSQAAQLFFMDQVDPQQKYIFRDGKKVECKRIHNFYSSHMFRTGYGKYFKKGSENQRN